MTRPAVLDALGRDVACNHIYILRPPLATSDVRPSSLSFYLLAAMERRIPAILDKVLSDPNCLGRRPLLEDVKRWEKWLRSVIETYGLGDAERGRQTTPKHVP